MNKEYGKTSKLPKPKGKEINPLVAALQLKKKWVLKSLTFSKYNNVVYLVQHKKHSEQMFQLILNKYDIDSVMAYWRAPEDDWDCDYFNVYSKNQFFKTLKKDTKKNSKNVAIGIIGELTEWSAQETPCELKESHVKYGSSYVGNQSTELDAGAIMKDGQPLEKYSDSNKITPKYIDKNTDNLTIISGKHLGKTLWDAWLDKAYQDFYPEYIEDIEEDCE